MISRNDLAESFGTTRPVEHSICHVSDRLPRATANYYVALGFEREMPFNALAVTEGVADDAFASQALRAGQAVVAGAELRKAELGDNVHGLDAVVTAPSAFHSYLKGRLDAQRAELALCVPAHWSEFSGRETADEFAVLCREVVPIRRWDRDPASRISLRFDNPRTGGGTGDGYVFASFDMLMREVGNLDGVGTGFIEILNYRDDVLELLSPAPGRLISIRGRDDGTRAPLAEQDAREALWRFLTACRPEQGR